MPDGTALLYNLIGQAMAPKEVQTVDINIKAR